MSEQKRGPRKDLTGQRFGKLTVLHLDEEFEKIRGKRQIRWICQCDCGTIKSIIGAELLRKNKSQKSCGCAAAQRAKDFGKVTFNDLTNRRFGKLIAKEHIRTADCGNAIWRCICDCGNEVEIKSSSLVTGNTISCGCAKGRFWENYIGECLKEKEIQYKREYIFPDLKDDSYLRFDFAIFKNNILKGVIEFQGTQHWDKNHPWYNEKTVKHDLQKKKYCKKNNIPLLEILFYEKDNIELILTNYIERLWTS